jgi:hypothetical protein
MTAVAPPVPLIRMSRIPREAIRNLITTLSICDYAPEGWSVIYQVEPQPFEGLRNDTLGAWIELSIGAFRSVGEDDYRQTFDATTGAYLSVFYGLRVFTLTIDARSFAPEIPAWDVLESIRLQLNNRRSLTVNSLLQPANLAWVRTHPTVSLNYAEKGDIDNRMIWRSTMDVELSWMSAAQVVDDSGAIIETVGQSQINAPPGSNDVGATILEPDGTPVT